MRKSIKESPNFTEHKQEERDKKREPKKEERFLRGPWGESSPPPHCYLDPHPQCPEGKALG